MLAFAFSDFRRRRHHKHVAHLTLVQSFGLEHQLKGLIPGHIFKAQSNAPGHRIGSHQIEFRKVGDKLQDSAHFDVLEVQRDTLTHVGELVESLFDFPRRQRLDADDVFVVCLIGEIIEVARSLEGQRRAALVCIYIHTLDRGRKIGDVIATQQALGDRGIQELDFNITTFAKHVHIHRWIGELQDQTTLTGGRTLELKILNFR